MTATNHTLAGIAISVVLPGSIAPLAAFFSHFVLDSLPHFGKHPKLELWTNAFKGYLVIDGLLSVLALLAAWLVLDNWPLAVMCGMLAALPDVMWAVENELKPRMQWAYTFHQKIQWAEEMFYWPVELVVAIALVLYIYT